MYSEIVILAMLHQGPRHGYEIKKDTERALGGMVPLNNKTLYLALKRFEEMGAVNFPAEHAGNDAEFFTRVAFFEFLGPPEREAILNKRLVYLEGCLDYLQRMHQMANEGECSPGTGISMSNAQRVLAFHHQRVHNEYQWIATWLEEMQTTR